jgi:hypothetical protein
VGLLTITAKGQVTLKQIQKAAEAGGDCADGVIAHQGQWLGGDTLVSFDRQAVALLRPQGVAAELLSASPSPTTGRTGQRNNRDPTADRRYHSR